MPTSFDEAYAIQDRAIALNGNRIGGWKVGRIADDLVAEWGCNRLAGPILSDLIVEAHGPCSPEMPLLEGFAAIEAELVMRIGRSVPADIDLLSVPDYIDEVYFGLEVASSPFAEINAHGPGVTASDFGNNFGLLLGPKIIDWRTRDLLAASVVLSIDGRVVGQGSAATMLDGPFGAVAFLARLMKHRGMSLAVGTLVSTGAITGIHQVVSGQVVKATFDKQYEVSCRTTSFVPHIRAMQEA